MNTRISKVFEAYTALADSHIEKRNDFLYLVTSSNASKKYTVKREENLFSSNDSATLWQHYAGYPILAVRRLENRISYSKEILPLLQGIDWKKENTKFRNDYSKAIEEVLSPYTEEQREKIRKAVEDTYQEVLKTEYQVKGNRTKLINL